MMSPHRSRTRCRTAGLARCRADSAARVAAHLTDVARVHPAKLAKGIVRRRVARLLRTRLTDFHARSASPVTANLRHVAGIGPTRNANGKVWSAAQPVAVLSRRLADAARPIATDLPFWAGSPSTWDWCFRFGL